MKFIHLLNPFISNEINNKISNLTLDSIENAKKTIKHDDLEVELCYTCYDEDLVLMKNRNQFKQLNLLSRSIKDIHTFKNPKKFPLIFDILDTIENIDGDYIIYTNIDINLIPNFYNEIYEYIQKGFDGFTINRVTIHCDDILNTNIEDLYHLVKDGEYHPGLDCFVFKKDILKDFPREDMCIGTSYFDRYIYNYIHLLSKNSVHMMKPFLTFHIGDDRNWVDAEEYIKYNKSLYEKHPVPQCSIKSMFYDLSENDNYLYFINYHYSVCKNSEDKFILKFLKQIRFYNGKLLNIGTEKSKLYFLMKSKWSGYTINDNTEENKLCIDFDENKNIKLLSPSTINMMSLCDDIGTEFDVVSLNLIDLNFSVLKTIPINLYNKCKIISVNFNDKDEMYNIIHYLEIYGYSKHTIFEKCVILTKY